MSKDISKFKLEYQTQSWISKTQTFFATTIHEEINKLSTELKKIINRRKWTRKQCCTQKLWDILCLHHKFDLSFVKQTRVSVYLKKVTANYPFWKLQLSENRVTKLATVYPSPLRGIALIKFLHSYIRNSSAKIRSNKHYSPTPSIFQSKKIPNSSPPINSIPIKIEHYEPLKCYCRSQQFK